MIKPPILTAMAGLGILALSACAAPAPTATPTTAPAAAATPTKAPTATPTKRPVTKIEVAQATHPSMMYLPIYTAIAKGLFQEEGLDVEVVATGAGAKSMAAVMGGSVPIAHVAAPDTITAIAAGQPGRVVAAFNHGQAGQMIIRKEVAEARGITEKMTLAEKGKLIKGLTFAASSPGSGTDYRVRYFLKKAGLDPDRDVEITYMATAAQVAAIERGSVDAITPGATEETVVLLRKGTVVMLADFLAGEVPGASDGYYMVAVGRDSEIEAKPGLFEAYVRGLWRGLKTLAEKDSEMRELLKSQYFPESDPGAYFDAWNLSRPLMPSEPSLTEARFKGTLDYRNETSPEAVSLSFVEWGTNKFVEAAKKQLGF